jgi:hypothetical protein
VLPLTAETTPLELPVDFLRARAVEEDSVDLDEVVLRWEVDEVDFPRVVGVRGFPMGLVRGGMDNMWLETGT